MGPTQHSSFENPASLGVRVSPRRITALYVVSATAWILVSDWLLARTTQDVQAFEYMAQLKGLAFVLVTGTFLYVLLRRLSAATRHSRAALQERVKELECLYQIDRLLTRPGELSVDILHQIVRFVPPAMQYPDEAESRVILDGVEYATPGFREEAPRLTATILVRGEERGVVEASYRHSAREHDLMPFLHEERALLKAVAGQVALIKEHQWAAEERRKLEKQLQHADRLATVGQLSAGVAHELNEPIGSILGFAQLVKKSGETTDGIMRDMEKIEKASLHAREIIRKLMIFSRQVPSQQTEVNLNSVIEDGLYFIGSRCQRAGIETSQQIAADLPTIIADPSQLHQVLVNLVVNAVHAMPDGGILSIRTMERDGEVCLLVQDTGAGMDEETRKQIFLPFFTTKDVGEGTGLGLSVVHGIVADHGGSIHVKSSPGSGSTFEVRFPRSGVGEVEDE